MVEPGMSYPRNSNGETCNGWGWRITTKSQTKGSRNDVGNVHLEGVLGCTADIKLSNDETWLAPRHAEETKEWEIQKHMSKLLAQFPDVVLTPPCKPVSGTLSRRCSTDVSFILYNYPKKLNP